MAVFPDRIVLKNSTDSSASIISEIGAGGNDPITQGEIVLGIEPGNVQIYTLDSSGNVITIATGSAAARAIVSDTAPTVGIGGIPLSEGDLWYKGDNGVFHVYYNSAWVEISGSGISSLALGGLSDVTLSTTPTNGQVLTYQSGSGEWTAADNASIPVAETGDLITSIDSVPYRLPIGDQDQVLTVSAGGEVEWADPVAVSVSELSDLTDVDNALAPSVGQVLVYNDTTSQWEAGSVSGTGTVTSVGLTAGAGIEVAGGPVTSSGYIGVGLAPTGVASGTYPAARITIGSDGRISAASVSGINDLSDVNTINVAPADGDCLIWSDAMQRWRAGNITGAVTSIIAGDGIELDPANGTGNVTISVSAEGPELGGIDDLSDVDTSTIPPVNGEVLAWDNVGGLWVPAPPVIGAQIMDDLTDVSASTPEDGQVLTWSDSESSWVTSEAGQGTVSSVGIAGVNGIISSGGPVTSSGSITVGLGQSGVTSGTYANPTINVDTYGRITSISDGELLQDPTVLEGDMIYNDGSNITRLARGTDGEVLTMDSGIPTWSPPADPQPNVTYLDDLADVDTTATLPTDGQALIWDQVSSTWVPGTVSGAGGAGLYMQETQTSSSSGEATFNGIGFSGVVQKVTADVDTWLVLYSSAANRSNDSSRDYTSDPSPGSGVVFEAYILAGQTVEASPGTTYFNNDATPTEAIYAAFRTQIGNPIVSTVSISAYGMAISGDYIPKTTLQAEVASSTDFADFQARIAAL